MRRAALGLSALLVLLAVATVLWAERAGAPLPWRGALTQHVWAEFASGHFMRPHCTRRDLGPGVPVPWADRDPTRRIFACSARSRDTTHFVTFFGRDGWVYDYDHIWAVPPARGSAVLDSLLTALTRASGPPTYCPRPENAPPGTRFVHVYWPPAPYARELSLSAPPADATPPSVRWHLVLRTTHRTLTCPRGS